jgi:hypothetical protein
MKKISLTLLLAIISLSALSQAYKSAFGVKGGLATSGINYKRDFGGVYGDFTVGGGRGYLGISALGVKQSQLSGQIDWYAGIGAYFWMYNSGGIIYNNTSYSGFGIGALGEIGLEYTFEEIPFNVGLGIGPAINIIPYFGIGVNGTGAIRYVID